MRGKEPAPWEMMGSDGSQLVALHLVVDPGVGFLKPIAQANVGFPAEIFFDERVVTVAPVDTPGRTQVVTASQLDARDRFDDIAAAPAERPPSGSDPGSRDDRAAPEN